MIADEVQSGIGRTGHLFAFEADGIKPDIIALAKGIAGGFPAGAVVATAAVATAMTPGTHGSTFGGNPLAMACAETILTELGKPGFMDGVRDRAAHLDAGLQRLADRHAAKIAEIRGRGFLRGIQLTEEFPVGPVVAALRDDHLLVVPAAENTLRLLPPLTVSKDEIDLALGKLDTAIAAAVTG